MLSRPLKIPTCRAKLLGVVFSKDRPLQLDATLRSFYAHVQDPDDILLRVLYTTSDAVHDKAYQLVAADFPAVAFVKESEFKEDLISDLVDFDYVMFVVDDTIFFRNFNFGHCARNLENIPNAIGFSLRLGGNTNYCYPLNQSQRIPDFTRIEEDIVQFEWTESEYDFNYPLELSSSLYRVSDIYPLLVQLDYSNPNSLESRLAQTGPSSLSTLRYLLCYGHSVAFSAPLNRVQDFNSNRAADSEEYSPDRLLKSYIDGARIDVNAFADFSPHGCHQEIELPLVKSGPPPVVSVIIRCYNQAEFLADAVASMLAQSYENWECIVVNDGSPDHTSERARELIGADPRNRIRLLETANRGLAGALNSGIRVALGRYILPLDADDMVHPDYLKETVNVLESCPQYDIVYVDEKNFGTSSHIHCKGQSTLAALKMANVHDYCSLYRKKVWGDVGGYSPAMYLGGEDWEFWVAASALGFKSYHLPRPMFFYRNRENTMVSKTLANLQEVWAHIVCHHPQLYSEAEKGQALSVLNNSPATNQRLLERERNRYPYNTLLTLFSGLLGRYPIHEQRPAAAATSQIGVTRGKTLPVTNRGAVADPDKRQPLVTVVISMLNDEPFIAQCVQSVIDQAIDDMEVIVVDLGSQDEVEAQIAPFLSDPRFTYTRKEPSAAPNGTSFRAWEIGTGKYHICLRAHDFLLPGHVEDALSVLETNPECVLTYGPCYWVDKDGRFLSISTHRAHLNCSYVGHRNEFAELLAFDNYITPSSAVIRRDGLRTVQALGDSPEPTAGDWDLFVRLAAAHDNFAFIERASTGYRFHPEQASHLFYAGSHPLHAHVRILEKSLASEHAPKLMGWEYQIRDHLRQRVAQYNEEDQAQLKGRVERLLTELENSALKNHRFGVGTRPKVSVIVPTLNRPELLQDALLSLVNQTYENWEAVVINDGGQDVSGLVASLDPKGRIRCVRHSKNRGPSAARNTGIRLSGGEIICYLDDDDRFYPEHLETLVERFQESACECVYTDVQYVQEELRGGVRVETGRDQRYVGIEYSKARLHTENFIPVNAWAHRRVLLGKTGMFDEEMGALEDWDLLLRIARTVDVEHVPKITAEVRERSDGRRLSETALPEMPRLYQRIYERYDDLGLQEVADGRSRVLAELGVEPVQDESTRLPQGKPSGCSSPSVAEPGHEGSDLDADGIDYADWTRIYSVRESDAQIMAERMVLKWNARPTVHLVVPARAGEVGLLAGTIRSLADQLYPGWGLTVVAKEPCPDAAFHDLPNLEWRQVEDDIASEINRAVEDTDADWVGLIRPGDRLASNALFACLDYADRYPAWSLIYTDEDFCDALGNRSDPWFKTEADVDLLRSVNCVGGFSLVRRNVLREAQGYGHRCGAENFDLALKVLERSGIHAIGHVAHVLYHRGPVADALSHDNELTERRRCVLADHLERCNEPAVIAEGLTPETLRVRYETPRRQKVSVIIAVCDDLRALEECLDSLYQTTAYQDLELVLVDEGSETEDTEEYLELLQQEKDNVRLVTVPGLAGNRAAAYNAAAKMAQGEYLVFVDRHALFVQASWLDDLLGHIQRPGVGLVAPRLVGPNDSVAHSALILGLGGVAGDAFAGLSAWDGGYAGRALADQGVAAVPAACLMVRRQLFDELGGFDDQALPNAAHHIDFCLRLRQRGLRVVWTPHALLGWQPLRQIQVPWRRSEEEEAVLMQRWLSELAHDPFYNRNLSLSHGDFRPRVESTVNWDPSFHDYPRVLGIPADTYGCGEYRVLAPLRALDDAARARCGFTAPQEGQPNVPSVVELERLAPDSLLLQATLDDVHLEALERYKRFNSAFKVFDMEDLKSKVPLKNSRRKFLYRDIKARTRRALNCCDRLIVTTEPIAEAYRHMVDDIRVVPNYLSRARWGGLTSIRRQGARPRVGWAGGQQHEGDLELLLPVIEATAHEVDWIFFGMCPEAIRPFVSETHEFGGFAEYPARLAALNLDLAVAPLEDHPFNIAKSNLRILEYGILGWPVICTDIEPYRGAPVTRLPNDPEMWVAAIRERTHDLDAAAQEGDELKQWVINGWMLEDHLDDWLASLLPGNGAVRRDAVPAAPSQCVSW